jgi:hypothetical protein
MGEESKSVKERVAELEERVRDLERAIEKTNDATLIKTRAAEAPQVVSQSELHRSR